MCMPRISGPGTRLWPWMCRHPQENSSRRGRRADPNQRRRTTMLAAQVLMSSHCPQPPLHAVPKSRHHSLHPLIRTPLFCPDIRPKCLSLHGIPQCLISLLVVRVMALCGFGTWPLLMTPLSYASTYPLRRPRMSRPLLGILMAHYSRLDPTTAFYDYGPRKVTCIWSCRCTRDQFFPCAGIVKVTCCRQCGWLRNCVGR